MTGVLLPALAAVVAALLVLGPVAWLGAPGFSARATPVLAAIGLVLTLPVLLLGAAPAPLELPVGLPGSGILVALDGFSALFLLLLFLAGTAAALMEATPLLPVLVGTLAAALLAADGFSVVLAFEAAAFAAAGLLPGRRSGGAVLLGGGMAAGLCLTAAMALLAPLQPWGLDLSFSGMRAHPPEGWRADAVFVLLLLAAAAPHRWLARAQAAMPGPAAALLVGAGEKLGLYLLGRVLFDLAGPAQPAWWGGALLALGAAAALSGAVGAMRADLRTLPGQGAAMQTGLCLAGLGLAQAARAADLAPLAGAALGTTFLLAIAQALGGALLALAAGAAEVSTGTRRLERLGGLLRGMPATGLAALVAALGLAALPPSAGFAAAWTFLETLIASARLEGLGWQVLVTLALLAVAGAMALSAVASVRWFGIAFLGRPRTPRAAAAQEVPRLARAALLAFATLTLVAGLMPGVLLRLAAPAVGQLLGAAPRVEAPSYPAAWIGVLLAVLTLGTLRLLRVRAPVGQRGGAVWEGGAPPPPPWLPFGDPGTQAVPAGFAAPLDVLLRPHRLPLRRWLRRLQRASAWAEAALSPSARAATAALLAASVLLLAWAAA